MSVETNWRAAATLMHRSLNWQLAFPHLVTELLVILVKLKIG